MSNNPFGQIQIRTHEGEHEDCLLFHIFTYCAQGGINHLETNGWVHYPDAGPHWRQPTFKVPGPNRGAVLQQLANQLRKLGIIPETTRSEVTDLEKTLDAKDEHIVDLRKVLDMVVSSDKVRLLSND